MKPDRSPRDRREELHSQPGPSTQPSSSDQRFVRAQYRTQDNLAVRIRTHALYGENNVDFATWVLDGLSWQGDEVVLDVGCGAGYYIDAVRQRTPNYVAADLSLGMLQGLAQRPLPRINLDVQQLPIGQQSVDVVLANHMLYHVPDIDRALREIRRVLRPGGHLVAATNSTNNMAELGALQHEALGSLNLPASHPVASALTFTLENGTTILRRHFHQVERRDLHGALVFPEPQPVIDYLASSYERYEPYLPEHLTWGAIVEALRAILQEKIAQEGAFRVNRMSGVFICWNGLNPPPQSRQAQRLFNKK